MNRRTQHSNAGTFVLLTTSLCLLPLAMLSAADSPVGTWRGQSICQVKESACRDEDSVYRAAAVAKSDTRITLEANKIVNGQEVNMGTSECSYTPSTHVLNCPLSNGNTMRLTLEGDTLNGTMTLKDGTLWRKIALRRSSHGSAESGDPAPTLLPLFRVTRFEAAPSRLTHTNQQ